MATSHPQVLLIDADDTLWENNIYFERAFEEFLAYLGHSTLAPQQVRDVLDEIELAVTIEVREPLDTPAQPRWDGQ